MNGIHRHYEQQTKRRQGNGHLTSRTYMKASLSVIYTVLTCMTSALGYLTAILRFSFGYSLDPRAKKARNLSTSLCVAWVGLPIGFRRMGSWTVAITNCGYL